MNAALLPQGDFCGTISAASGDEYFDKFSVTGLKLEKGNDVNAPILTECPVTLECKLVKTLEFPDGEHRVYLGEVASYHVAAEALDGDKSAPVKQFDPQKSGMAIIGFAYDVFGKARVVIRVFGHPLFISPFKRGIETAR